MTQSSAYSDKPVITDGAWFQAIGDEIARRGVFVGCPHNLFELCSRDPILVALMEGMTRQSDVLEIGCGCLRSAYWFIDYLEPGRWHGIEPNTRMLQTGIELILADRQPGKRPRFDSNTDFDFTVFGSSFDFVIAFSIWSHASKRQIDQMLNSFIKTAKPGAKFVATWYPTRPTMQDYTQDGWVGRSHECDVPGIVAHDTEWLMQATAARGLTCRFFNLFTTVGQNWVVVERPK